MKKMKEKVFEVFFVLKVYLLSVKISNAQAVEIFALKITQIINCEACALLEAVHNW